VAQSEESELHKYTLEEATALLPQVRAVVRQLRDVWVGAADERQGFERAQTQNRGPIEASLAHQRLVCALWDLQPLAAWLRAHDLVLRQPEIGLIDFRAEVNGQDAFLCWRLGEDRIAFWHGTDEGFDSRKPLPEG